MELNASVMEMSNDARELKGIELRWCEAGVFKVIDGQRLFLYPSQRLQDRVELDRLNAGRKRRARRESGQVRSY